MTPKDKLVAVLQNITIKHKGYSIKMKDQFAELIAKHLSKNDVVQVVKCKNCKHYIAGFCTRDINGRTNMFRMCEDDFCSYGERKADNG